MFDTIKVPKEAYDSGVLDKDYHALLLQDLPAVCAVAGVVPRFVWSSMIGYCGPAEVRWMTHLRNESGSGMLYRGVLDKPIEDKMMALVGACLRNYVDARMIMVNDLVNQIKAETVEYPSVLLIPNLCLDTTSSPALQPWATQLILGHLITRMSRNLKTVVYVNDLNILERNYGSSFKDHLWTHYKTIEN